LVVVWLYNANDTTFVAPITKPATPRATPLILSGAALFILFSESKHNRTPSQPMLQHFTAPEKQAQPLSFPAHVTTFYSSREAQRFRNQSALCC
jgi:hypothetical protein